MNTDPFVSCPYNPQHRVPQSRIQRHLVKCELKYPPLAICPYNATHRFPKSKLDEHLVDCPSMANFPMAYKVSNTVLIANRPIVQKLPQKTEDECWD